MRQIEQLFPTIGDDEIVARCRWLMTLSPEIRRGFVDHAVRCTYEHKQTIIMQGDSARGLFLILNGRVEIWKSTEPDDSTLLHIAGPGFSFGALETLTGSQTQIDAVASGSTMLLNWSQPTVERLIAKDPDSYRTLSRIVFERYALLMKYVEQTRYPDLRSKIAAKIINLLEFRELDDIASDNKPLDLSQVELAALAGVSRQHVNRVLGEFRTEGLISLAPRKLRVVDAAGLRHAISSGRVSGTQQLRQRVDYSQI